MQSWLITEKYFTNRIDSKRAKSQGTGEMIIKSRKIFLKMS